MDNVLGTDRGGNDRKGMSCSNSGLVELDIDSLVLDSDFVTGLRDVFECELEVPMWIIVEEEMHLPAFLHEVGLHIIEKEFPFLGVPRRASDFVEADRKGRDEVEFFTKGRNCLLGLYTVIKSWDPQRVDHIII